MEEGSERGQEDRGKDLGEVEEESRETNQEPNAVRRRSLTQKGMSHKVLRFSLPSVNLITQIRIRMVYRTEVASH